MVFACFLTSNSPYHLSQIFYNALALITGFIISGDIFLHMGHSKRICKFRPKSNFVLTMRYLRFFFSKRGENCCLYYFPSYKHERINLNFWVTKTLKVQKSLSRCCLKPEISVSHMILSYSLFLSAKFDSIYITTC